MTNEPETGIPAQPSRGPSPPGNWLIGAGIAVAVIALILAVSVINDMRDTGPFGPTFTTAERLQAAALVGVVPGALGFLLVGVGQVVNLIAGRTGE